MPARFCSACGAPLTAGSIFCPSCGARILISASMDPPISRGTMPSQDQPNWPPPGQGEEVPVGAVPPTNYSQPTTVVHHVYDGEPVAKKSHAGAYAAIVIVLILILFLFVVPVSTSFSRNVSTLNALSVFSNDPSAYASVVNISFSGSAVTGTFSVSNDQPVAFYIMNGSGTQVFALTAGSGTFSFNGNSGSYAFVAISLFPATVSVSGSITQPEAFGLFNND
jgi:hypothetical protein